MYQDLNWGDSSPWSLHQLETPKDVCIANSQSQNILDILPTKPILDALIEAFFSDINHHRSIIQPTTFISHYIKWSASSDTEKYQDAQFTTLVLMMCACVSPQSPDYHAAAQRVAVSIPAGSYSLTSLQWKILSICWLQGEARFVEAWHTIGLAIQEAYELGYHEAKATSRTGRQIWRVLHCWNWKLSLILGRPMIMNDIDSEADTDDLSVAPPSPTLSTRLQYHLVSSLSRRWHTPHRVDSPAEIRAHTKMVEEYISSLPAVYSLANTDTSNDQKWPWLVSHRYYVQAMAYFMILQPYKIYLSNLSIDTAPDVRKMREEAVHYSVRALEIATRWSSRAMEGNDQFHIIVLCLFDTAAFLSTSLVSDGDAVEKARRTLERLGGISQGAKTSYVLLCRIMKGMNGKK
ncbi:uncharacterized protein B0J16DRAFT_291567 [Fusarium flagelliforme]|uniref:uncharacterized protein n=1 Tax=Fusarium flagelliforme TaxID=2675880 RepID=UPI001E8CFB48|nr:uncharacterized protein B0J16DRAFT_291567 [Fusarium flagelliforme]KAH7179935.1 hypothetical protein B0J16DRAFT_291567 [Fusarium flagelliforme]